MQIDRPLSLLGGMSPSAFMRRHWQKRPCVVRQAMPQARPPVSRDALFALAARDDVESRIVERADGRWSLRHGPFARRSLPALSRPAWTLLVQGVDLHDDAAHALLQSFAFVPQARLDDLMISYATDGGGVGAHVDSYDVFLLQVQGRRRWRVGPAPDRTQVPGVPLRLLARFEPEQEWLLEPGDMLYVPPGWGHDGIAEGECMTCSIGFRAPARDALAIHLLQRLGDAEEAPEDDPLYRDAGGGATETPGQVPAGLQAFAERALQRLLARPGALAQALGESLSEPKPQVQFDGGAPLAALAGLRLDRRTRLLYDDRHVFVNGESFRAQGKDARLLRELADQRWLPAARVRGFSDEARALIEEWALQGWLHADGSDEPA